MVESSPVALCQSNGVVERAIGAVEAHIRVLRSALEERVGVKLGADHPVSALIPEYAALLLNRFEVSRDGRTAYERNKSKKVNTLGL